MPIRGIGKAQQIIYDGFAEREREAGRVRRINVQYERVKAAHVETVTPPAPEDFQNWQLARRKFGRL